MKYKIGDTVKFIKYGIFNGLPGTIGKIIRIYTLEIPKHARGKDAGDFVFEVEIEGETKPDNWNINYVELVGSTKIDNKELDYPWGNWDNIEN